MRRGCPGRAGACLSVFAFDLILNLAVVPLVLIQARTDKAFAREIEDSWSRARHPLQHAACRMSAIAEITHAECLLFDFGGTLDADGITWKERFRTIYGAEGLELAAEAFDRIFYDADDPLVGMLDVEADLDETVRQLVGNIEKAAAQLLGADPERASRVANAFLDASHATLRRNRAILEALRARYRLGIVSNFYGNLSAVCQGVGFDTLFDTIIDSERVGIEKPDPGIFRAAMDPLGARPDATIMIGDSLHRDREGARGCGIGFIWIAPAEEHAAGEAHEAITGLGQLAELLL